MNTVEVENLIGERLGLDLAALGAAVSPRSIENRMRANHAASEKQYLDILVSQPRELDALAAELVVAETWFFRGGFPLFQRLAQLVAARAGAKPGSPVRVLSVPCSTGEEPYSLAIALREIGLPLDRCTIDAVDLSRMHIDRAAAARFSSFAFREPGPDIRAPFFRQDGAHWIPLPQIRQMIQFRTGNIIDASFLAGEAPYDLIICRNLIIYLTSNGRKRAIAALDRLLTRTGNLCVTPAEADRLPAGQFVPERPIEFGLYRRANPAAPAALKELDQPEANWDRPPIPRVPASTSAPEAATPPPRPLERRATSPLEAAQELADAGRLQQARTACEQLIRSQIELPDAYTLLGVLHQAEGRYTEAGDAFRKALYLAPNHPEALTHMIVWCESQGDAARAGALRKHLQRLAAEGLA